MCSYNINGNYSCFENFNTELDKNQNCSNWALQGECSKNPDYMLLNCPISCTKQNLDKKNNKNKKHIESNQKIISGNNKNNV